MCHLNKDKQCYVDVLLHHQMIKDLYSLAATPNQQLFFHLVPAAQSCIITAVSLTEEYIFYPPIKHTPNPGFFLLKLVKNNAENK